MTTAPAFDPHYSFHFGLMKGTHACRDVFSFRPGRSVVQWASRKKRISYDFKFYVPSIKFPFANRNSFCAWNCFRYRARNMVKSPKRERDDGVPRAFHSEFISLILATLKCSIGFKYPTRLIRPVRSSRHNHAT